jgi:hypothetical protein
MSFPFDVALNAEITLAPFAPELCASGRSNVNYSPCALRRFDADTSNPALTVTLFSANCFAMILNRSLVWHTH